MKALSIRPAWAWAIIHAGKDVENRSRRCHFRGRFLVHASLEASTRDLEKTAQALGAAGEPSTLLREDELAAGGIIGSVELVDVMERCDSPWYAQGSFAWVLRNPRPLPFFPCRGHSNWFHVPDELIPLGHRA